jgi:hypothetical protein
MVFLGYWWNKSLFQEMYRAFKDERSDKNLPVGWYEGELWFFDNYAIPLAGKRHERSCHKPSLSNITISSVEATFDVFQEFTRTITIIGG